MLYTYTCRYTQSSLATRSSRASKGPQKRRFASEMGREEKPGYLLFRRREETKKRGWCQAFLGYLCKYVLHMMDRTGQTACKSSPLHVKDAHPLGLQLQTYITGWASTSSRRRGYVLFGWCLLPLSSVICVCTELAGISIVHLLATVVCIHVPTLSGIWTGETYPGKHNDRSETEKKKNRVHISRRTHECLCLLLGSPSRSSREPTDGPELSREMIKTLVCVCIHRAIGWTRPTYGKPHSSFWTFPPVLWEHTHTTRVRNSWPGFPSIYHINHPHFFYTVAETQRLVLIKYSTSDHHKA